MKFRCKEISISDKELGYTITFSDTKDKESVENQSYDDIKNSMGNYLMLQRTYPEDEFEKDFYYIEASDFDKSDELKNFKIELRKNLFIIEWSKGNAEIELTITDSEFQDIIKAIKVISNNKGSLKIVE